MKINTIGRKVNLKQPFLDEVEAKLKKLDKFFPNGAQATITVTVEKRWQTVEISIKDRNAHFRSERNADKMELALDLAVDTLEAQIVKNKEKISEKYKSYGYDYEASTAQDEEEEYEIVRKKVFNLVPQTVEDAILEMNMLDHTFFMFKDIVTEEINLVYKRKDGKYGLLLPE